LGFITVPICESICVTSIPLSRAIWICERISISAALTVTFAIASSDVRQSDLSESNKPVLGSTLLNARQRYNSYSHVRVKCTPTSYLGLSLQIDATSKNQGAGVIIEPQLATPKSKHLNEAKFEA